MARTLPFDKFPDRYDAWFQRHPDLYRAELEAVRCLLPSGGRGVEIGVGSGKFALPLGIRYGVEPSETMALRAKRAGIDVSAGIAEALPLRTSCADKILMVTTICFVDDPHASMKEAWRILRKGRTIIIAFVDRDSHLGKRYLERKNSNVFYKDATFFSAREVLSILESAGFRHFRIVQTILPWKEHTYRIEEGFGTGGFVVIGAEKP